MLIALPAGYLVCCVRRNAERYEKDHPEERKKVVLWLAVLFALLLALLLGVALFLDWLL